MKKINFKKEKISIQNIGKQRFWFGVLSGFITSIILSLFFNTTREIIRIFSSLSYYLMSYENNESDFFNYFFVSLSAAYGLSVCIWVWMGSPRNKNRKHKIYKEQVKTSTQLFFWFIIQIACFSVYWMMSIQNYFDYPINLYKDHSIFFILIPIFIFTQSWFIVRRIYKTGKWVLASLVILLLTIFILKTTTSIDQSILNKVYYKHHEKTLKYIENVISSSESNYDIKFSKEEVITLKKIYSWSSEDQISYTKRCFDEKDKISINNIILHRIIIHNLKGRRLYQYRYHGYSYTLTNWRYALPKSILKQLNYYENDSNEAKELFKVLREEILLVNKSKIILDDSIVNDAIIREDETELKVNIMVVDHLIEVRGTLMNLEKYSELSKMLPKIKNIPLK